MTDRHVLSLISKSRMRDAPPNRTEADQSAIAANQKEPSNRLVVHDSNQSNQNVRQPPQNLMDRWPHDRPFWKPLPTCGDPADGKKTEIDGADLTFWPGRLLYSPPFMFTLWLPCSVSLTASSSFHIWPIIPDGRRSDSGPCTGSHRKPQTCEVCGCNGIQSKKYSGQ